MVYFNVSYYDDLSLCKLSFKVLVKLSLILLDLVCVTSLGLLYGTDIYSFSKNLDNAGLTYEQLNLILENLLVR